MAGHRSREILVADPTVFVTNHEMEPHAVLAGGVGVQVPLIPPREIGSPRRGPGNADDGRRSRMKILRTSEAHCYQLVELLGLPTPCAVARNGGDIEWGKQRGPANPTGLKWVLVVEERDGEVVDRFLHCFLGPRRARGLRPRDLSQPIISAEELREEWMDRHPESLGLSFMDWCAI